MTEPSIASCIVCPALRAGRPPRTPNNPPVCGGCRERVRGDLLWLPDAYAVLPLQFPPNGSASERVSGSREAPLPIRVDPLDLDLPARQANPTAAARLHPEDQIGHLSVATTLDSWVRDWRAVRDMRELGPEPTVPNLVAWLANRLDWALDNHPAADEFADEITSLARVLRRTNGTDKLVHRLSAPCPTCELVELFREDGADYVECRNCHRLWTEDEYHRLCVILAVEAKARVST